MPKELENQHLKTASFKHVVQDVLTPYAVLFKAAIRCAEYLCYQPEDDVMPLIHEALEICYSREPLEARLGGKKATGNEYWYPPIHATRYSLNS